MLDVRIRPLVDALLRPPDWINTYNIQDAPIQLTLDTYIFLRLASAIQHRFVLTIPSDHVKSRYGSG